MERNFLKHYALLLGIVIASMSVFAQVDYTLQDDDVFLENGYIIQCFYNFAVNANGTNLTIPNTLQGQTVKGVINGSWSFFGLFSGKNIVGLTLPNTMEDIGGWAFSFNNIAELNIPASINRIGEAAFNSNALNTINGHNSTGIIYARNSNGTNDSTRIISYGGAPMNVDFIPENVTVIDSWAFGQIGIISVFLPNSIDSIKHGAFCLNQIANLTLSDGITYVGNNAFTDNKMTSINIPGSVDFIGFGAFGNNLLTSAIFEEGYLQVIPDRGFSHNQLTTINIPGSVISIGSEAFRGNSITQLTFTGNNLTTIGREAFFENQITSLSIPGSVNAIEIGAFYGNSITDLVLNPGNLATIGEKAFMNNQINLVSIPNNATHIGERAFMNNNITNLSIPNSVSYIGGGAFNANAVTTINGLPANGIIFARNSDGTEDETTVVSYCGTAKVVDFIPDNVTVLDNYAFSNNNLTIINFPNSIKYIKQYACSYNFLQLELALSASIVEIGDYAFAFNALSGVFFDENILIHTIGEKAFYENSFNFFTLPDYSNINGFAGWFDGYNNSVTGPPFIAADLKTSYSAEGITSSIAPGYFDRVKVYPNPVRDKLVVDMPDNGEIRKVTIFNFNGETIRTYETFSSLPIDMSTVPNGVYFVVIERINDDIQPFKIVKL